jgi:hypothetical protein
MSGGEIRNRGGGAARQQNGQQEQRKKYFHSHDGQRYTRAKAL